jgi:hypothetical protein
MPELLKCGLWCGVSPDSGPRLFTSKTMAILWILDCFNPVFGFVINQTESRQKKSADFRQRI